MADTTTVTIWNAFTAQLQVNVALAAYVKTFYFLRAQKQFSPDDMPLLHVYPARLIQDEYLAFPKQKTSKLIIVISGKVYGGEAASLLGEQLKFDDLIRNAVEQSIQLSGLAILIKTGDTTFDYLDDTVLDTRLEVEIQSQRFTAGNR